MIYSGTLISRARTTTSESVNRKEEECYKQKQQLGGRDARPQNHRRPRDVMIPSYTVIITLTLSRNRRVWNWKMIQSEIGHEKQWSFKQNATKFNVYQRKSGLMSSMSHKIMRNEIELHFSRLESKLTRIKLGFRTQHTSRFVEQSLKKMWSWRMSIWATNLYDSNKVSVNGDEVLSQKTKGHLNAILVSLLEKWRNGFLKRTRQCIFRVNLVSCLYKERSRYFKSDWSSSSSNNTILIYSQYCR